MTAASATARTATASGSTRVPARIVDGVGQREEHPRVDEQPLGVAAGAPRAEADAVGDRVRADLLVARAAPLARPALRERQHAHPVTD